MNWILIRSATWEVRRRGKIDTLEEFSRRMKITYSRGEPLTFAEY